MRMSIRLVAGAPSLTLAVASVPSAAKPVYELKAYTSGPSREDARVPLAPEPVRNPLPRVMASCLECHTYGQRDPSGRVAVSPAALAAAGRVRVSLR
jgi:hypothetical protein